MEKQEPIDTLWEIVGRFGLERLVSSPKAVASPPFAYSSPTKHGSKKDLRYEYKIVESMLKLTSELLHLEGQALEKESPDFEVNQSLLRGFDKFLRAGA